MAGKFEILIIDDDLIFTANVERMLWNLHSVTKAHTLENAKVLIKKRSFDIVLLDKYLPNDGNGIHFIPELKLALPYAVIIVLTSEKSDQNIVEALRAGASDYLHKTPSIASDLLGRLEVAVGRLDLKKRLRKAEELAFDRIHLEMVGRSESIKHLRSTVRTLYNNPINILISGETGTGKELVARALNQAHGDKSRPFVSLNCGAIPEHLVESELFGHVKGAFTGATSEKVGKIEVANGGDLFLDEIGELSLETQVKLLRVLQEGEFTRVGSNEVRKSKFRVVAATNRDLEQMIAEKKFREDLFYRIAAYEMVTTPLRERKEDIPELVTHFIKTLEGPRFTISDEALQYLERQPWPGNIRELKNKVECAIAFAKDRQSHTVVLKDVVSSNEKAKEVRVSISSHPGLKTKFQYSASEYKSYINELDKNYLIGALEINGWDPDLTARKLGMSRSKIYSRISTYGLKKTKSFHRKDALREVGEFQGKS